MLYILSNILGFALVGALTAAVIKFLQWCISDLTFGLILSSPTLESVVKIVVIFAIIGAICGLINGLLETRKDNKRNKIWINNEEIEISYRIKPPHFRNISDGDIMAEFSTCGFCKHYDHEKGCEKYGVKGYGVGSVVKTVCDDFKSSM